MNYTTVYFKYLYLIAHRYYQMPFLTSDGVR